jgi:diaminopropionate ammonia-lyase
LTDLHLPAERTAAGGAGPPAGEPVSGAPARALHARLPGYAESPLRDVPELAAELGVGRVWLKDESGRFGLPSFKPLGASWAVCCAVAELLGDAERPQDPFDLRERAAALRPLRVVCATDGNHGRAVAHVAAFLGLDAEVVVPAGTAAARIAAIEAEGARVEMVDGDYDEAQRRSAALAAAGGGMLVSDTSWPGNEHLPARVTEGYGTIFAELEEQLDATPDVAFVPVGVGALAAAAVEHLAARGVRLVSVEPEAAACALASARAGEPVTVPGPHESSMAGLNCGTVSMIAWPAVRRMDAFCSIGDDAAEWGVRRLAELGLDRGECSGGVLGAARELLAGDNAPGLREALGLGSSASVLLLLTESVTDPEHFERITGRAPRP